MLQRVQDAEDTNSREYMRGLWSNKLTHKHQSMQTLRERSHQQKPQIKFYATSWKHSVEVGSPNRIEDLLMQHLLSCVDLITNHRRQYRHQVAPNGCQTAQYQSTQAGSQEARMYFAKLTCEAKCFAYSSLRRCQTKSYSNPATETKANLSTSNGVRNGGAGNGRR